MAITVDILRRAAATRLAATGIDTALLDANVLLGAVMDVDPARVVFEGRRPVLPEIADRFEALIHRRLAREPVAYITGCKEFAGLSIHVAPGVMVPRPETEVLLDAAQELLTTMRLPRVIDVGTGSGAIAGALARLNPQALIIASDRSMAALRIASCNARDHGVADRLWLAYTDGVAGMDPSGGLLVANLPYVPREEIDRLQPEIANWEPRMALDGGADGLAAFRRLFMQIRLCPPMACALEVGVGQSRAVVALAMNAGFGCSRIVLDLAGWPRVVLLHHVGSS